MSPRLGYIHYIIKDGLDLLLLILLLPMHCDYRHVPANQLMQVSWHHCEGKRTPWEFSSFFSLCLHFTPDHQDCMASAFASEPLF